MFNCYTYCCLRKMKIYVGDLRATAKGGLVQRVSVASGGDLKAVSCPTSPELIKRTSLSKCPAPPLLATQSYGLVF